MKYFKLFSPVGGIIQISDVLSLEFKQVAPDLHPVWLECPAMQSTIAHEQGAYVDVTPDYWLVFDQGQWRPMNLEEHYRVE